MLTDEETNAIHELGFCCFEHLADYYFYLGHASDPASVRLITCEDTRQDRARERACERIVEDARIDAQNIAQRAQYAPTGHTRVTFNRRRLPPTNTTDDPPKVHLTGQALLDAVERHRQTVVSRNPTLLL
jgi:hypothetical protein